MRFGFVKISEKSKPVVIAECCDNHFGKIENAIKMVDLSKKAGAEIVKFQHHIPDEEMLKIVPKSKNFKEPLYEFLKKNALKIDDHIRLFSYCKKKKIQYLCTPFSFKAAEELKKIGIQAFKIGSGEMTDIPSLKKIAKFNLPMIVSTGMSTSDEIRETYIEILKINKKLALMNCTSEYPPVYEDINLKYIEKMKKLFPKAIIGHSDHTSGLTTCIGAATLGAKIIEKHVTLDKKNVGPDKDVSVTFEELKKLVDSIEIIHKSSGSVKKVNSREVEIRKWAFRSVVSIQDIDKDQIIQQSMIWSKRPGTGIPSKRMNEVIGKKAKKRIPRNTLIKWSDLI